MRKPPIHRSIFNAFKGVYLMITTERNFKIEFTAFLINIFLIFYLQLSKTDALLILMVCFGVLCVETVNTAIEKLCDIVQPDFDKRIGFIKDIAAGAVALMTFLSIITGICIYSSYISF
ncbi:diacylglycerol kinase family protein [Chryseobacterium sp. CT-SW4]|uniref:diacylglycerol kinase family protein n=1 Tax=Chryseobacterium sp. SW-1 TaxID=3157343 RepID=UPI003B02AABE